jgi:hypothetical protein
MARAGARPDILLLRGFRDFGELVWTWPYLIAVAIACITAVARRNHAALVQIQWLALGCGLFLSLYGLGSEVGEKVDPRLLFAILGGVASLYSCYACLIAHMALWMLSRGIRERANRNS